MLGGAAIAFVYVTLQTCQIMSFLEADVQVIVARTYRAGQSLILRCFKQLLNNKKGQALGA